MIHVYTIQFIGGSSSRRGRRPRRGGVDSQGGYVSKILCVETKESGPLRGRASGTPPRSANAFHLKEDLDS